MNLLGTIEFPNLFSGELRVNQEAFTLFGINVYWYGVIITAGVILAAFYAMKRSKAVGLTSENVFDAVFWGVIGGLIGARAYYVIFFNLNPANKEKYTLIRAITDIRSGGLAVYGGIIGGVLAGLIAARLMKIRFLPILDLAGISFLIGQGIGRWGNFFNQETFGAPTAGNLPWGMTGDIIAKSPEVIAAQERLDLTGEIALVHPCFLYESLWCLLGVILLSVYLKKLRSFDGEIFLLYAIWYGTGRAFIEQLRTDSLMAGGLKVSQVLSVAGALFALILLIYLKNSLKHNKNYKMYVLTKESRVLIKTYERNQKLEKEKAAAKQALKQTRLDIESARENKKHSILAEEEETKNGDNS